MTSIGGYFSLELGNTDKQYHHGAIKLNTARNCFEYILRTKQYKKVYIPYYTCEVLLGPLQKLNVEYEFYHIDENLDLSDVLQLNNGEALLYTNYFGLKQAYIEELANIYKQQLIVDNAQAFFAERLGGIDTFYSPRKFIGVADGGLLYTDKFLDYDIERDYSYNRMSHLLKRIDLSAEEGYKDFRNNDESLVNQSIKTMSVLTEKILSSVDYEYIKQKRIENYNCLHRNLGKINRFNAGLPKNAVPMVYPFWTNDSSLKQKLIANKIYVATYWPNVFDWTEKDSLEYNLANNLLAIPCDQRYSSAEMNYTTEMILSTHL